MKKIKLSQEDAIAFTEACESPTKTNSKFLAAAKRYKKAQEVEINTTDKYYWCINHPKIGVACVQGSIELTPHMVNPANNEIDLNDHSLNTKQQWWIEYSKLESEEDNMSTHYWQLDCGGDTVDEAVDALYNLILNQYGDY